MTIQIPQTSHETVPAGQYRATLVEVQEDDGQYGPFVKLKFRIDEAGFEGTTISGAASATFSPMSKLYAWTQGLLGGRSIPTTYNFNSDDILNRPCVLTLTIVRKSDNGGEFNRIQLIAPAQRPAATTAKSTAAPRSARQAQPVDWQDAPPPGFTEEDEFLP